MEAFEHSLKRPKARAINSIGSVAYLQRSFANATHRDAQRRAHASDRSNRSYEHPASLSTPPARVAPQFNFAPPSYSDKWREHADEKAAPPAYSRHRRAWWKSPAAIWGGVALATIVLTAIAVVVVSRAKAVGSSDVLRQASGDAVLSSTANVEEPIEPHIAPTPVATPLAPTESTDFTATSTSTTSSAPSATVSLDPRFSKSFWGIGYQPTDLLPNCLTTQASVDEDLKILSQLTTRLRMYSSLCRQEEMVLDGITRLSLDLRVALGITVGTNETQYINDRTVALDLLQKHGTKYISHVIVGNEHLLRDRRGTPLVVENLLDVRKRIEALGIDVPIANSDASIGYVQDQKPNLALIDDGKVDVLFSNVHGWWSAAAPSAAAKVTTDIYNRIIDAFGSSKNKVDWILGECGWPATLHGGRRYYQTEGSAKAEASIANLQIFLDTFICQANAAGMPYYFFEYTDEPWKGDPNDPREGVEPWWGLFDAKKQLKPGLKLPNCPL